MKKLATILISIFALTACSPGNEDLWNSLPAEISDFITEYWPGSSINAYTPGATSTYVRITDGPGITFDSDYAWTTVDGYGMPVPQQFVYDQLPEGLYDILESQEVVNQVFSVSRQDGRYSLTLLDSTISYPDTN